MQNNKLIAYSSKIQGGAIILYLVGIVINNLQLTNNNLFFTGTIEQNSMRGGLLFTSVFPVVALIFIIILRSILGKQYLVLYRYL